MLTSKAFWAARKMVPLRWRFLSSASAPDRRGPLSSLVLLRRDSLEIGCTGLSTVARQEGIPRSDPFFSFQFNRMHRELYCQIKYLFSFVKLLARVLLWCQVCLCLFLFNLIRYFRERNLPTVLFMTETPIFFYLHFHGNCRKKCCLARFQERKFRRFKTSWPYFTTKTRDDHILTSSRNRIHLQVPESFVFWVTWD